MTELGRLLIVTGAILLGMGLVLSVVDKIPWLGRLPGDLLWRRDGVTVYIPVATSILVSLVLTILMHLLRR